MDDGLYDNVIDIALADVHIKIFFAANCAEDPVYASGLAHHSAAEQLFSALGAEFKPAAVELVGLATPYNAPQGTTIFKLNIGHLQAR